jgi:hypothetical protein
MNTKRPSLLLFGWLLLATPAAVHAQFNYITTNGTITITGYTGGSGDLVIPSTISGLPVTSIGDNAFFNCRSLTSVTIGNGVTSIGWGAFEYCTRLINVMIPNSVTSIGDSAFNGCSSLVKVIIGSGVTNIGDQAFSWCTSLSSVYFQGNAPGLGSAVFSYYVFFEDGLYGKDLYDPATVYYPQGTTGWDAFATNSSITNSGIPIAVWQHQIETTDISFGVRTNQFGFNINWASGMTVVVEASTSLSGGAWTPLQTNTLSSSSFYFSDPEWTKYPSRFYRVRSP